MTRENAIKAYTATDFQVYPSAKKVVSIRVNQKNKVLDQFLEAANTWAFITAWNPKSEALSPIENKQRNELLVEEVKKRSFIYFPGAGVPDDDNWSPEDSFLIVDISKEAAIALGKKYRQNAIVFGEVGGVAELVFCLELEK